MFVRVSITALFLVIVAFLYLTMPGNAWAYSHDEQACITVLTDDGQAPDMTDPDVWA